MDFQLLLIDREINPPVEFQILSSILDFNLIHMYNGLDALKWMGSGNLPDLIFANAAMDLISSSQFVKQVKNNGFINEIPIIAYGWPEELDRLIGMVQSGANQYFIKPLSISELQDCLFWEMNQLNLK